MPDVSRAARNKVDTTIALELTIKMIGEVKTSPKKSAANPPSKKTLMRGFRYCYMDILHNHELIVIWGDHLI
jgi:hypothetical protein